MYTDTDLIFLCFLSALIGLIPAFIASNKGHKFFEWWFLGTAFFILALPLAIFLKPKSTIPPSHQVARNSRKCPYCSEFVLDEAQICKHCKNELPTAGFSLSEIEQWRKKIISSTNWNEPIGKNTTNAIQELLKLPLENSHKLIFVGYSDSKSFYIEDIRINNKLLQSRQSALIATYQRLIFVDPNEPYVYDCFYNTITNIKISKSNRSILVNIQDKGDNIINFSITPARTVNSNQLNSSFENLISFFEQIKIFTSIKVTNLSKSFTKDNELISKVGEALKHGDKTKAGLLIDQALKKDFTNSTAWELLHNLIGQGKEFSKFQKEFTSRYYPDKSHLLDNK